MSSLIRLSAFVTAILLQAATPGWSQAVPARLVLFNDPAPTAAAHELVLGTTTLDEARALFPDAPIHPGPMSADSNPTYITHEPDFTIGSAVVQHRHAFFLGSGRASLLFDQHKRLVSIHQARFAYHDPITNKSVIESTSWDSLKVSRNDFRSHYPKARGEWFDRLHYRIEGMISDCLAVTAWFTQFNGYDQLGNLSYHYTCPTQPSAQK